MPVRHATLLLVVASAFADVREHPGGKVLPHKKYVRVVSERASPLHQAYIKSVDGLYIAAAIRKPAGAGPFPAVIYFHGAPGGRGMERLVTWSLGATGGPVWERLLQEGYVVAVADYRNTVGAAAKDAAMPPDRVSYVNDGVSVLEHVRSLPYVDKERVAVYGVSRGGNLALHLISRAHVAAAVLGAPAPAGFLGANSTGEPDGESARRNIEPIRTPILILVGTADRLLPLDRKLYELLAAAGKPVRMEIYEKGYHDFVVGPQGHEGRSEPLMDSTLDALEKTVEFLKQHLKR
jgi:dienelactone hydrolase